MTASSPRRLVIAIVSIVAAGLLLGTACWASDRGSGQKPAASDPYGERAAYYSATDLLSRSSRVVIATYLDSSTREVDVVSRGTGQLTGDTRTDVIQRFEVVETLKGSISPGEIQEVGSTSAFYRAAREGRRPAHEESYEVLSPVKGKQYVLFLRSGPLDPNEPDAWGFAGEPGMATADADGSLQFLLTKGFEEELREEGKTVPPFTATLDEIRAEIARQAAAPPPTPATPAPEPTPAKTVPSNP